MIELTAEPLTAAERDELEALLAEMFLTGFSTREKFIARKAAKLGYRHGAAEVTRLTAESEGRRAQLMKCSDERRDEWARAEQAERERDEARRENTALRLQVRLANWTKDDRPLADDIERFRQECEDAINGSALTALRGQIDALVEEWYRRSTTGRAGGFGFCAYELAALSKEQGTDK